MYSEAEINNHIYESGQIGYQRGFKTEYKTINTIPEGTARINYLKPLVSIANSMKTEVEAYTPLVKICENLKSARDKNFVLRSQICREFHVDVKHREYLLTARLTSSGHNVCEIKNQFMREVLGRREVFGREVSDPIQPWKSIYRGGAIAERLCKEQSVPKIIEECNDALFNAVTGRDDQPSLLSIWHKALDELCFLNPDASFNKEGESLSPRDLRAPLHEVIDQMVIKFDLSMGGIIWRGFRNAAGVVLIGAAIGGLIAGPTGAVTGALIGLPFGVLAGIGGAYSEISRKLAGEYHRVIDQSILQICRNYTLDEYKRHRTELARSIEAASQPMNLNSDVTYKSVSAIHDVADVILHKAAVLNYVLRREYAAEINRLIEQSGGIPVAIAIDGDLNAYFEEVEAKIAGADHRFEADIRELIAEARIFISTEDTNRSQQLDALKATVEASKIALDNLIKSIPVERVEQTTEKGENGTQEQEADSKDSKVEPEKDGWIRDTFKPIRFAWLVYRWLW